MKQYKDIVFEGSTFPDDTYRKVPVKLNLTIQSHYIPILDKLDLNKGLKCLMTAMTHQEGFRPGSRSFRTNNPGNIGNTDSGANKGFKTLTDGVVAQAEHLVKIATAGGKYYPLGKEVFLKPFDSPEIKKNPKYGLPWQLPGYRFTYTGQLDQFIKIYSTGARVTNSYINTIVSYFKMNGLEITPQTTLAAMIELK